MALEANDLSFSYGGDEVLSEVNAKFYPGSMHCLLGRNGSGKSTLLRLLAGLLRLQRGLVEADGLSQNSASRRLWSRKVAYLPQHHRAVFSISVIDYVLTGRAAHVGFMPQRGDIEKSKTALTTVGMSAFIDRSYLQLSGGEQQLVRIARLLVQEAEYLLLDEPTASLDYANSIHIMTLLRKLTEDGLGIVCVMHDPVSAWSFADELSLMVDGKLLSCSIPPEEKLLSRALGLPVSVSENCLGLRVEMSERR